MAKNNLPSFFYLLYSDKTWVFDQSECAQGSNYIISDNQRQSNYISEINNPINFIPQISCEIFEILL